MDNRQVQPEKAVAVMRAAGVEPLEDYPGATKPWLCECLQCHNHVKPRYNSIKHGQGGCRYCARRRISQSQRIDPDYAVSVMQEAGYEPLEEYTNTDAPWRCRCLQCGTTSTPTYTNVKSGHRCAACYQRRRGQDTRLDPDDAAQVMRTAGVEPLVEYPGADVPWRCICTACQREVHPRYHSIRKGGSGCAYCAGKKVDPAEAAELFRAAGVDPFDDYPGPKQPWLGQCRTCGAVVAPTYGWVRASGRACKYCSRRAMAETKRLDSDQAAAVMRAAGFEPLEDYPGASKPWACWCPDCSSTVTPVYGEIRAGRGCPGCRYRKVAAALRLSPDDAAASMRQAGLEPLTDYPGSAQPWPCRCTTCDREVTPSHHSIQRGQGGCEYCAGKVVDPAEAAEIMRAAGLEPLQDYPGSAVPWLCRCTTCAGEVRPTYGDVSNGSGCRHCWEQRRGEALRMDANVAAEVMRAVGLEPLDDYPGADTPWPCHCQECGAHVSPTYGSARDGHGCRHCAARDRGKRHRLDHEVAADVMRAAELEPLEDYPTATQPWRCQCRRCGTILVSLTYAKVQSGRGCHVCRPPATGFDRTAPGIV